MIWKEKNGVEWLEYEILQDTKLKHAVFLKKGGVSVGCYESLNVGDAVGDLESAVAANKNKIKECMGVEGLVFANQVHGNAVTIVSGPLTPHVVDGLATNRKNIGLAIRHADCQATIFYDPIHHVVANVHAGWRGNVDNIYQKAVDLMKKEFHTKPADLLVCISPSLGPNHAEFIHYQKEFPESFWSYEHRTNHFDLWEIAKDQLLSLGILPNHIEIARMCTFANNQFFSYRRDRITGRHATVVSL